MVRGPRGGEETNSTRTQVIHNDCLSSRLRDRHTKAKPKQNVYWRINIGKIISNEHAACTATAHALEKIHRYERMDSVLGSYSSANGLSTSAQSKEKTDE